MPEKLEVSAKPVEKPKLTLPNADLLKMREVKWVIVTEENYKQVFADIKKSGRPIAIFGLTDKGYANLGLNFSDIRAYVQQQKSIIAAYEAYYKGADEAISKANKEIQESNQRAKQQQKEEKSLLKKIF
jgi:hypothetical protein|tara:strand:+ start:573 stop:959 length:387 start_codon:yes stop_codon:yes gene_type:complete